MPGREASGRAGSGGGIPSRDLLSLAFFKKPAAQPIDFQGLKVRTMTARGKAPGTKATQEFPFALKVAEPWRIAGVCKGQPSIRMAHRQVPAVLPDLTHNFGMHGPRPSGHLPKTRTRHIVPP